MILGEQKEQIQKIVELFEIAEQKVKEVERLDGKLAIPSINELRYVGYHLAKALCSEGSIIDTELDKARNHCNRAIYDAHEVGIIYFLENIKAFKTNYSDFSHLIPEVISTYLHDLTLAHAAADFINQKNSHLNNDRDRDAYYRDAEPYYKQLSEITKRFDTAEPMVKKKIIEKINLERRDARRFTITSAIAIVAVLVTVIALFK